MPCPAALLARGAPLWRTSDGLLMRFSHVLTRTLGTMAYMSANPHSVNKPLIRACRSTHLRMDDTEALIDVSGSEQHLHMKRLHEENEDLKSRVNELEAIIEQTEGLCEVLDDVDVDGSFWPGFQARASWLVGLLILQSGSSFILAGQEDLLAAHPVVVYFLTMLVGAGGNAGNQSAVRIIRGLAVGAVNDDTLGKFMRRELLMALAITLTLCTVGGVRVILFHGSGLDALVITISLAVIVSTSIVTGALLPVALHKMHVDAAHAGTSIQVLMDILGVSVTCFIASYMLGSSPVPAM